jgi:T5SS/PEP-CTERM-associated repeat protein
VALSGPGSAITLSGTNTGDGLITVGNAGLGGLSIANGATLITNPGTDYTGPAADIAAASGADGSSVTVTGTNSTWNVGGTLVVGDGAAGSLGVSAGGTVDAGSVTIGAQSGASGGISVTGTDSALDLTGTLQVGGQGDGNVHVSNGGVLDASELDIGTGPLGSTGVFDAEGTSTVNITGDINIGATGANAGAGVMLVGGEVNVSFGGALNINAGGVLIQAGDGLSGGTLNNTGTDVISNSGTAYYSSAAHNSGTIIVQNGADWLLNTPTVTNGGTGTTGVISFGNGGGTIGLDVSGIDNTQTIEFQNGSATALLEIGSSNGFHAVIDSFDANAEIVLQSFTGSGTAAAAGSIIPIASIVAVTNAGGSHTLELFNNSGTEIGALTLSASLSSTELSEIETVNADGGLGMPCFAEGTLIRTTCGDVPVEKLREGDLVPTELGGEPAPVVWIGRRTVDCARHPELARSGRCGCRPGRSGESCRPATCGFRPIMRCSSRAC